MRYLTTIFFFILSLKSYSQIDPHSIDKIVYDISNSVSSHKTDSLSNSLDSSITYTVFTKDATPVNIDTLILPNHSLYHYQITILCMNTANGDAGNGQYNTIIKNINGKLLTRNTAVMALSSQSTISTAKYSISKDGIITITGVKNIIMKWTVKVEEISHLQVP